MNFKMILNTVLFSMFSLITLASNISELTVKISDPNTIALNVSNVIDAEIHVTLKDAFGETLHDETLAQNNINSRKYNLRQLPTGNYTLLVSYDDVIKIQSIKKENSHIETISMQTITSPKFIQHKEYVDMYITCSTDLDLSIEMRDEADNTIFSDNGNLGTVQKRFNLSQLENGEYKFFVRVSGNTVYKEFTQEITWSPVANNLID